MRILAVGAHPDDVEILCAGTLAIREAEPEVMFVHNTADYHPDHRTSGSVAMDTLGRVDFEPALYVDVTDTFEVKRRMLERHASQDAWLRFAEAFRELRTYPSTGSAELLPKLVRHA